MPLEAFASDALGVSTIVLVILLTLLGLVCVFRSAFFQLWVRFRGHGFLHLYSYFAGPSLFRSSLLLLSFLWSLLQLSRLTFLNQKSRFLREDLVLRERICEFYVAVGLGFAEPSIFLMLSFLLHAALQQGENGTLNPRWSRQNIGYVGLFCFPCLVWNLFWVFVGGRFVNFAGVFTKSWVLGSNGVICTFPLSSTIFLGGFNVILTVYVTYLGTRILSLAINKGLRRRIYVLMFSVDLFLPLRAVCLGLSVLAEPAGGVLFEAVVFVGFCAILCCVGVGIVILVYFPVADVSALRDPEQIELVRMSSSGSSFSV
ncbi:hypothetical protein LUZ60_004364 [Juncus effusus]|nr:hypothetical protein LUZ60_004364 [Juncus effusus]